MNLSIYEIKALEKLYSAMRKNREDEDIINDCRSSATRLIQHFCSFDCKVSKDSENFRNAWAYLTDRDNSFFWGKNEDASYNHKKEKVYKEIHNLILAIKRTRQDNSYSENVYEEQDFEIDSNLTLARLKKLIKLYFVDIRAYKVTQIKNLKEPYLLLLSSFFPKTRKNLSEDSEEIIRESIIRQRPTYYVLVLIDASSSMFWPYLKNRTNSNKPESSDYNNAIKQTQNAITKAHNKAIDALRGSAICQQGYLKVCQYIFNHETRLLNSPKTLNKDGMDDVKKLTSNVYYPDGMTALYDSIEESTRLIYDKYINPSKKKREIDKLILVVITDGEDTIIDKTERYQISSQRDWEEQETYLRMKKQKTRTIKESLKKLRGHTTTGQQHLESAILIGLTNSQFSSKHLLGLKKELGFDESIAILQNDSAALRTAFRLFSGNALNI